MKCVICNKDFKVNDIATHICIPTSQPFTNKQAHQLVTITLNLSEVYNESGFLKEDKVMLKVNQDALQDSLKLHKFLYEKEKCKATYKCLQGVIKMLLRLSALIHEGRKETNKEKIDSSQRFFKQYGRTY